MVYVLIVKWIHLMDMLWRDVIILRLYVKRADMLRVMLLVSERPLSSVVRAGDS